MWYSWRGKKASPHFSPGFLAGWSEVTSMPLLYMYMICRPVAYSQGLWWGIMKFLPRNLTCNDSWALRSAPGVGAPQPALVFRLASQWYLTVSQQPCWYQALGQDPNLSYSSSVHFQRGASIIPSLRSGHLHTLYLWPKILHLTPIAWIKPPHSSDLRLNIIFSRKPSLTWQRSKASQLCASTVPCNFAITAFNV